MAFLEGRLARRALLTSLLTQGVFWEAGPRLTHCVTPLGGHPSAQAGRQRPRLHALTYATSVDTRLNLPLATAERYGFFPVVLGYGHAATWAYGLSALANEWRSYVLSHAEPDDLVLFFDAYDIIFQASQEEIIDRYLEMEARSGHELFYNADMACTNPCEEEKPKSNSPWAYLNSGIYLGRARIVRELYRDPLPDPLVDSQGKKMRLQYWHVLFYWAHRDKVTVDDNCELTQVVTNIDNLHINRYHSDSVDMPGGKGLVLQDGRLRNTITNTTPLILHFPGAGHWPDWAHPERVGTCAAYELFRTASHPNMALVLEKQVEGKFIGLQPWKAVCTWAVTFWDRVGMKVAIMGDDIIWLSYNLPAGAIFAVVAAALLIGSYVVRVLLRLRQGTLDKSQ